MGHHLLSLVDFVRFDVCLSEETPYFWKGRPSCLWMLIISGFQKLLFLSGRDISMTVYPLYSIDWTIHHFKTVWGTLAAFVENKNFPGWSERVGSLLKSDAKALSRDQSGVNKGFLLVEWNGILQWNITEVFSTTLVQKRRHGFRHVINQVWTRFLIGRMEMTFYSGT